MQKNAMCYVCQNQPALLDTAKYTEQYWSDYGGIDQAEQEWNFLSTHTQRKILKNSLQYIFRTADYS